MCVHINIDEFQKKALIFEFDNVVKDDSESFDGFINYSNFDDIGLHPHNVKINSCAKFVYLTRSRQVTEIKKKNYWRFWVNLLVVEPYSINPQAAHFKSSKVFYMA